MEDREELKKKFEEFFAAVPFEKRGIITVNWEARHNHVVTHYYGIGVDRPKSIEEIGQMFEVAPKGIERVLSQARKMCLQWDLNKRRKALQLRISRGV